MSDPSYWLTVTIPPDLDPSGTGYSYDTMPHPVRILTDDQARRWAAVVWEGLPGSTGMLVRDGARLALEEAP